MCFSAAVLSFMLEKEAEAVKIDDAFLNEDG